MSRSIVTTPQTKRQIEAMLGSAGIRPRRRYGQHFLIDGNLMRRLVASAELRATDVVLEIGAGTGSLTGLLAETAGRVVAVEVDGGLFEIVSGQLGSKPNVTLLHTDVLEGKSRLAPAVVDALRSARQSVCGETSRPLLVANLPYQTASPVVMDLLLADPPPARMCFTVQLEVARRMLARPGGSDYGPISIAIQIAGKIEQIARVPPQAFWPVPKVESAMLRLDVRPRGERPITDPAAFVTFVRSAFLHRRKKLAYNLREALGPGAAAELAATGRWDTSARPERIPPEQWVEMWRVARERPDVAGRPHAARQSK